MQITLKCFSSAIIICAINNMDLQEIYYDPENNIS
eukprot:SAG11_NODE_39463_length_231_cov_17.378788_2_plen_34_part_01